MPVIRSIADNDGVLYPGLDESRFVTGPELRIDGGFTAGKMINQRLPEGMCGCRFQQHSQEGSP